MNSENPLVSVIIPAYNAEHFIERTIISVFNQTYRHLEIIVVDDGSCDRTAEIVRVMTAQDQRIVLIRQANGGVAAARNTGIRHAKGDFIAPLDADDIWYPENIAKQLSCFQKAGKSLGLCYAWTVDIDDHDHLLRNFRAARIKGSVARTLLCHNFLGNASASLIRRECFDVVGGYDDSFHHHQIQGCEDWELYLRMAEKYEFDVVPEFLIGYRRTPESMSSKDTVTMAQSHSYMLKKTSFRRKDDPDFCYRLSKSSFYMYLARQSDLNDNPNRTVKWLLTALQLDPVTVPFRYGFYVLLLKSLISTGPDSVSSLLNYIKSLLVGPYRFFRKADASPIFSQPSAVRIQFKLLVGNMFHNLISRCSQQRLRLEVLSPKSMGLQASTK